MKESTIPISMSYDENLVTDRKWEKIIILLPAPILFYRILVVKMLSLVTYKKELTNCVFNYDKYTFVN